MNNYDLSGQVAVVTGGSQGIGRAVCDRLLASGAQVAVWDLSVDAADASFATALDITDADAVESAVAQTEAQLGSVSILVNSAGIAGSNAPVEDSDPEEWRRIMDVNLTGTFLVNGALVPVMKVGKYGRIVNIASVAGKEGNPSAAAYSASKAGVIALTKSLGKECADYDIAVNCVTPAAANTAIFDQMSDEHIAFMLSKISRQGFVTVDEIAAMIGWMVSAENSFATGAAFDLSGGRATY